MVKNAGYCWIHPPEKWMEKCQKNHQDIRMVGISVGQSNGGTWRNDHMNPYEMCGHKFQHQPNFGILRQGQCSNHGGWDTGDR